MIRPNNDAHQTNLGRNRFPRIIAANWKKMIPPTRPSKSEEKVFEKYISEISQKANSKALILGSTVELRTSCLKHGIMTTVVDYDELNYDAFSRLVEPVPDDEIYFCEDWRDFETEEKFNLIVGDLAFNMLIGAESEGGRPATTVKDDYRFTFNKMFQFLTPGGMMVQRIWVRPKEHSFRDANEILQTYRKLYNEEVSPFTYLFLPFAIHFYDYEREWFITSDMVAGIKKLYKRGIVSEHEYLSFYYRSKDYTFPNSILDENDLDELISEVLPGIGIEKGYGSDSFAPLAPIYILRKQ